MSSLPVIDDRPDLYDDAERWSVDELRAHQLTRLQATVHAAYEQCAPLSESL